jgi:uncharacterized peroxidase-related enzyme
MAHIRVPERRPGIAGLLLQHPDTGRELSSLAQTLLRGPSPLSPAERELIATYVSERNACTFCTNVHAAVARNLFGPADCAVVDDVLRDGESAAVSPRLRALLRIAGKVQAGGRRVTDDDVALARAHGADDRTIHDTVLIAAAFCMFNRYVDGLATAAPADLAEYEPVGTSLARQGYLMSDTDAARS